MKKRFKAESWNRIMLWLRLHQNDPAPCGSSSAILVSISLLHNSRSVSVTVTFAMKNVAIMLKGIVSRDFKVFFGTVG
jgi:hypothetical protein